MTPRERIKNAIIKARWQHSADRMKQGVDIEGSMADAVIKIMPDLMEVCCQCDGIGGSNFVDCPECNGTGIRVKD